ncbi:ABC transporter permease subunit [Uruburuella testudinis]|uniref:ABC transporter permease subunit n=1 Tax=Uruburuella testudinis TaxID=1282863 RepID=A0ABY4DQ40_9NEIS|nr:ABC transporter permease subunit [Uruburuella testudinis]UOO80996.1 ABC transporter permease subunit [Uruburuella testudinis]
MSQTRSRAFHYTYLTVLMLVMLVPVAATLMYATSSNWSRTILPENWTLKWLLEIWSNPRFLKASLYSALLSTTAAVLSIVIVFPVLLAVHTSHPKWEKWISPVLVLPFTLPPVVASVGMLQLYSGVLSTFAGTFLVLTGCYFTIVLPFVYRSLDNNFRAISVKDLIEASALLGASRLQTVRHILMPNLKRGLTVAFFISIAFLIGEFVFINILSGGHLETIQIYLYSLKNRSGHLSSAVVISYFMVMLLITLLVSRLSREKQT